MAALRAWVIDSAAIWLAGLLTLLIALSPWGQNLELGAFDLLSRRAAPGPSDLPITLVLIDEESMARVGRQWPWPRTLHARLLDQLKSAGVAVVAFDVLFAEPAGIEEEDAALEASIRTNGPVVLASDLEYRETAAARLWMRIDPLPRFVAAGALPGLAAVELDRDGVLRRVPRSAEALWRRVALELDRRQPGVVAEVDAPPGARIRYLAGSGAFTSVSYYRLLDPDRYLAPDWREHLRDNVVIVGRSVRGATELGTAQADLFLTPFFAARGELMPGVEVHATVLANMVEGRSLRETPGSWRWGLLALVAAVTAVLSRRWRPLRSAVVAGVLVAGVTALMAGLFVAGWWLPGAGALLVPVLAYLAQGGQAYFQEQARRRQIRRAFEHYVPPPVVDRIVAHPEELRLGGERRVLTILFTDLAGFTHVAEQLPPEVVADVLNRHLGDLTEIVLRHGGTVDKFIGDSVMAFWGAPMPDPAQAQHALAAAADIQLAMERLRREVAAPGASGLRIRIGLHRGDCVVGNLGGEKRFAYTAVGDSVNLASRLEGVNKVYGTTLLVSGAVVEAAPGHAATLRLVDRVRVVGRDQAIDIYTPCPDPVLRAASAAAFDAYRRGDLRAASAAWADIEAAHPSDGVAKVFVKRVQRLEADGLPAGWQGITTLDSK